MSPDPHSTLDDHETLRKPGLVPFLALLAVLIVALFLRVYRLDSVPFGWHPDEAVYALYARDILAGRSFPIFFASWTGREVMYSYLQAGAFGLLGDSMFTARLVSAFIGMLTVVGTYALGRRMFNRRVGLFASALIAVSLLHVIDSRNGYRAVIQPLIQLPVLIFLFQGLRSTPGQSRFYWHRFVLAGVFLGLTQYTYSASRFFPVLVLCIVALGWIFTRPQITRHGRGLLLMFGVALAVFAPLLWYFLHNWDAVFGRASDLSVFASQWAQGQPWQRLLESVRDTLGMFTVRGDPNYRFNLADQPVFGVVEGALFWAGLFLCLWRAIKLRGLPRLAHLSLLVWLPIMLLPMTLSAEGLPYYLRAIGTLPAIYYFPALFLDACLNWGQRLLGARRGRPVLAAAATGVLLLAFGLLAVNTYRDYFSKWHVNPRNDDDRHVAMVYVADYLRQHGWRGELYISTEFVEHPTLAFLADLTDEQFSGIHWFDGRQSLPLPSQDAEATYIFLAETPPNADLLSRVPSLGRTDAGYDRFGRPAFEVYVRDKGSWPEPAQRGGKWSWEVKFEAGDAPGLRHPIASPTDFGGVLSLEGYDSPAQPLAPGELAGLVLYWRIQQRTDQDYSIFAHLLDSESHIVGEYDGNGYPSRFWNSEGNELLLSAIPLTVKPGTPPGEYQLEVGVYDRATGERLPVNENGQMVADRLLLVPVQVR